MGSLKAKAEEVDPCLVEIVEKEGPWNTLSKATLIDTGPQVTKDILDAVGIGEDRVDLLAFLMAVGSIYSGRALVADKIEKMRRDKEREREEQRERQKRQNAD